MNLDAVLLAVPAVLYGLQAANYAANHGRWGMCLAFTSYAMANVGFILDSRGI